MKVDIKHLQKLSALSIDEAEGEKLAEDIDKILEFVDQITKLDVQETKKEAIELGQLREDKAAVDDADFDPLLNAPKTHDGCYLTPLVVE